MIRGVSGNASFRDAIGAHGPPFVMVIIEPDPGNILKRDIFCDLPNRQVAMEIKNGHPGRVLMIQGLGCGRFEQELFRQKGFHSRYSTQKYLNSSTYFIHELKKYAF